MKPERHCGPDTHYKAVWIAYFSINGKWSMAEEMVVLTTLMRLFNIICMD